MNTRRHKVHILQLLTIIHTFFSYSLAQLTFPSSRLTISDAGINFFFEFFDTNNTVLMGLEMNRTVDYFSIGFSSEGNWGMKNFDMVAFIFIPSGSGAYSVNVLDMYSTKNDRPPSDTQLGGKDDYNLLDYYVGNGKTQVLFERAYDTGDKYDYTFQSGQSATKMAMSWAWLSNGRHEFADHGPRCGTFISQMYNGLQSDVVSGTNTDMFIKAHSYIMLVAWALLIDIAIWIGRYHKASKYVLRAHIWLTLFIYAMTIFMTALILSVDTGSSDKAANSAHLYIGFIMLGIILVQVGMGFVFRYKLVSFKVTKSIASLSQIHMALGFLIYLIAKAQLIIGLYLFKKNYVWILAVWYGFLVVCWLTREYYYRRRSTPIKKEVKAPLVKEAKAEKYKNLMRLLNNNISIPDILETLELKGMNWAILDNSVFEIKDFTHPGGNFMLKEIQGREIGRFIYGVAGLESFSGESQHHHSKDVESVIQGNLIGKIKNNQQILVSLDNQATEQQFLLASQTSAVWSLSKKVELSTHTARFEFECSEYKIDPWIKDIRHLGRHMKVSCLSHSKTRLYTLVLSQTECRSQRRNLLWKKTDKDAQLAADLLKTQSKVLPLLVKRYGEPKSKTFSSFLHNSKSDKFMIEGPYGTGLGLTSESKGVHYILAGGTGIFPFLDLFDYLLENILVPGSGSNIFKNGFKLHIFASFNQISDFVGLDICEKLVQACRDNGMEDAVKMTIRAKDAKDSELFVVTKEIFDSAFIKKHIDSECEKTYVCGPPMFNQQIPLALKATGLTNRKIMLV